MVVGVFWQPLLHGSLPRIPSLARAEEVTFVGTREGRPYCPIPYTWPSVRTMMSPSEMAGVPMITSFISFFTSSW